MGPGWGRWAWPASVPYTDPRDQLFGAARNAYDALWTGTCFAHPPETDQDVERAVRWALPCARAQQKDPLLIALLLPGHPFTGHAQLTAFPEVCFIGTFSRDAPILHSPEAWSVPQSTEHAPSTPTPKCLGLYLIGNELGHQTYQREAIFHNLAQSYYRLHTTHAVGKRYSDMFDWDPEAPRAAQQCETAYNLIRRQWDLIVVEEEALFRPERRFKRILKRNPATNDHLVELLTITLSSYFHARAWNPEHQGWPLSTKITAHQNTTGIKTRTSPMAV
jgi:hypothetical protein